MKRLVLIIDLESLQKSDAGTISGKVAFHIADEFFPEANWNDLAVAVCLAWVEALVRVIRRESISQRVMLMDGPYAVKIALGKAGPEVDFVQSRLAGDIVTGHWTFIAEESLRDAVVVGDGVCRECEFRGWRSGDLTTLHQKVNEARKILREFGTDYNAPFP
jgi:hypothetical protein